MMQFVIRAYDGEGMLDKRMEVRPRHLKGMEEMRLHVICAGGEHADIFLDAVKI